MAAPALPALPTADGAVRNELLQRVLAAADTAARIDGAAAGTLDDQSKQPLALRTPAGGRHATLFAASLAAPDVRRTPRRDCGGEEGS